MSVTPHRMAARTPCEVGVSSHWTRNVPGSAVVPPGEDPSVRASARSRSDTYRRAKAETGQATTAMAAQPTAMATRSAGTFTATLSHVSHVRGKGACRLYLSCPPVSLRQWTSGCPSPFLAPLPRVEYHVRAPVSSLVPSCGERVAWPTVPAGGSPHLHSVPSDVGFVQASCLVGSVRHRDADVIIGSSRSRRAGPLRGGVRRRATNGGAVRHAGSSQIQTHVPMENQ